MPARDDFGPYEDLFPPSDVALAHNLFMFLLTYYHLLCHRNPHPSV